MKYDAYIVKNSEEFNFIDSEFLGNHFHNVIVTSFDRLITKGHMNHKPIIILYSIGLSDLNLKFSNKPKKPAWDFYSDFLDYSDKEQETYNILSAFVLMRKYKINKINAR